MVVEEEQRDGHGTMLRASTLGRAGAKPVGSHRAGQGVASVPMTLRRVTKGPGTALPAWAMLALSEP
jgi:hypothetical protein